MKKFTISIFILLLSLTLLVPASICQQKDFRNPKLPIELRVELLLQQMTLEEKIAQMQCELLNLDEKYEFPQQGIGQLAVPLRKFDAKAGAEKYNELQKKILETTRLGIPVIIHDEALHGLVAKKATSFPQAIGLASTWNPDLMYLIASAAAEETKSRGIHQILSPVVNIARDMRWGRVEETYGEDTYLTSKMGVAFCKAFEEKNIITTPKHYVANIGDGGRDSNPVHFSERLLREIYFPAFKACFQQAGARSVMAAYNSFDGIPCSSNRWLLTDILRNEWGFKGFVVSDYGSVGGIFDLHHTAGSKEETAAQAVAAGMDVELPGIYIFGDPLKNAVKTGMLDESVINTAVRRILRAKFELGLFENPFVHPQKAEQINDCEAHRKLALEAARQSIVLLKNENHLLPFSKKIKSIAVLGPLADKAKLGGYSGFGMKKVSLLEGLKNKLGDDVKIFFERGAELGSVSLPPIPGKFLRTSKASAARKGLTGEYFDNKNLQGKPVLVRTDEKIYFDYASGSPDSTLPADQFSVRWTGKLVPPKTGMYKLGLSTDDGVRFYLDGKLLVDQWRDRGTTTDLVKINLEAGREYDVKIEYYENGGYAFASFGWDFVTGEDKLLEQAVATAKKSDAAIIVAGIVEGEGKDRANLDLSPAQEKLISAVAKTGVPTIVVLETGSAVTMSNWIDQIDAIVQAWYPGEEGGNGLADVLFGDYNPGGKLPITFPQFVGQCPLYYNHKPTGRGYDYADMSGKPLFPFGYGLSYTTFSYGDIQLSSDKIKPDENVTVVVEIENSGKIKGDEVVQLYLHDTVASVARPVKELRRFKRITLEPGEKRKVTFTLTPEDFAFYDASMKKIVEPGTIEILIGSSSEDIRSKAELEIL